LEKLKGLVFIGVLRRILRGTLALGPSTRIALLPGLFLKAAFGLYTLPVLDRVKNLPSGLNNMRLFFAVKKGVRVAIL